MDQYSPILKQKIEVYLDRSRKTIQNWLNAYILAEARIYPRRAELIGVYDYLMLDLHLKGIIRNRKNKVIGEKWHLVDDLDVPLDEETKLLKTAWFRKFVSLVMDARFQGYSLIELDNVSQPGTIIVKLIERRNTNPDKREVLIRPTDIYGISIDEPQLKTNYVLVDGDEGLGLLLACAPDVIYKRYAKAAWTEHAENFSLPFLHGKTDMEDADAVATLRTNLALAGRERILLTGHNDEIEPLPMSSSDAHKIYDELIERCNSELSKNIQGQTMTSDNGSSRSQGEVHERVSDEIALADREFVESVVNDELIPRLIEMGYPLEGARFTYNMQREASTEEKVKVFDLLLKNYDIDPLTIKETFGVQVAKKVVPETLGGPGGDPNKPGAKPGQGDDEEGEQ